MVRVTGMRITASQLGQTALTVFPDGLEHPKFRGRKSGRAHYIVCRKDAVEELAERKSTCLSVPTHERLIKLIQNSMGSISGEAHTIQSFLNK